MILNEGLREHDLTDLVLPVISIDEYESKVQDDGIVVGFFVKNEDSANDLNRFIQKGVGDFLDTDVSPAPDEDGNYVVFVEYTRDFGFLDQLFNLLKTLDRLTDIYEWDAKIYDHDELVHVRKEILKKSLRFTTKEENKVSNEELGDFLSNSSADEVEVEEGVMTFRRSKLVEQFTVDYFGKDSILDSLQYTDRRSMEVKRLQMILGENWVVFEADRKICAGHPESDRVLILS